VHQIFWLNHAIVQLAKPFLPPVSFIFFPVDESRRILFFPGRYFVSARTPLLLSIQLIRRGSMFTSTWVCGSVICHFRTFARCIVFSPLVDFGVVRCARVRGGSGHGCTAGGTWGGSIHRCRCRCEQVWAVGSWLPGFGIHGIVGSSCVKIMEA
jgi:hypothetical protein